MSETETEYEVDPETGEVLDEGGAGIPPNETTVGTGGPDDDAEGEAEEGEQEEEAPPTEQEPEQAAGLTEADVERNSKAMNRAADAYIKKVVATLGDDLSGMEQCPLCAESWPGLRFPTMPAPENLARVRVAIGLEPGDNLPNDHYSRACDTCDGWGYVASGSKVPGQTKLTCYDCGGNGWKPVGTEREGGAITGGNVVPLPQNPGPPAVSNNDPPEVEKLKQLGYVVVSPIQPIEAPNV